MLSWLILLQLGVILLLTYLYLSRKFRYWSDRGVPGPSTFNPLGNLLDQIRYGQANLEKQWLAKYGKVYGWYKTIYPSLTIIDPALIKQVLVKDFHVFVNRGGADFIADHDWKSNFFNVEGEEWKRIRAIVSPSFTTGKLRRMHGMMEACVDKLINYLDKVVSEKEGKIDAKNVITGFTIDVIASTSFATETNANGDRAKSNAFVENGSRFFEPSAWRMAAGFLLPRRVNLWLDNPYLFIQPKVFRFFVNLTKEILRQRRNEAVRGETSKREDFVQLMMDAFVYEKDLEKTDYNDLGASMEEKDLPEERKSTKGDLGVKRTLTDGEIITQSIFLFTAGFDTTSNTLTNALYNLALHPEIQERLFKEITTAIDGITDESEYFDVVNNQIPYLDAVMKETFRMGPPVPRLIREVGVDGYKLGGIPLEKGTIVDIGVYASHFCEDHFPDPETFNPERFMPENKDKLIPYTYLPFGDGPRNCLGMRFAYQEIRLCLAKLVKRFQFERTLETPVPLDFANMGLLTVKNVHLKVSLRTN